MDGDAKYLKRKVKAGSLDVHPTEKALGEPQTREYIDQRVHRMAMVTFWRTFHHDGVFMRVWGACPPPFTLHCEKSLFVLASRQKIPALWTEIPAEDIRTICLLPIEFF